MEAAQVQFATTTPEELPLLDLFTRLREAGLPLGIDEYRLILEALQKGFGTTKMRLIRF